MSRSSTVYSSSVKVAELRDQLSLYQIRVLNAAGNRGSNLSAEQLSRYHQLLNEALSSDC